MFKGTSPKRNVNVVNSYKCACGQTINMSLNPEHWGSCINANKHFRVHRHNDICLEFGTFTNSITKSNIIGEKRKPNLIIYEHCVRKGKNDDKKGNIIADVSIKINNDQIDIGDIDINNFINDSSFTCFDISLSQACSVSHNSSFKNNINSIGDVISKHLSKVEDDKKIKYHNHLGREILQRFSPVVFDITGSIGPITKKLLDSKFLDFPHIHNCIKVNTNYDKAKDWFLKRVSFAIAKNNYRIFDVFSKSNGHKF